MMHNQRHFSPKARGHHALYLSGEVNHCPGCGRTHWIIGRISAECAFCATALPFAGEHTVGEPTVIFTRGSGGPKPVFRGRFIENGKAA